MDETQTFIGYYDGFAKQKTPNLFFTNLADYLEYMDSVPVFNRITKEHY